MPEPTEDSAVDLAFVGRTLQRLVNEIASLRDDMDVMSAIVRRLDSNQARMLEELRAIHAQHQRTAARVRALEERE
jgi:hypothetical protein